MVSLKICDFSIKKKTKKKQTNKQKERKERGYVSVRQVPLLTPFQYLKAHFIKGGYTSFVTFYFMPLPILSLSNNQWQN
jgi:cell division protein FtsB